MNLSLIPTEDLIKEIESRFDHTIIATEFRRGTENSTRMYFSGGVSAAIGLCEKLKYGLLTENTEFDYDETDT